MTDAKNSMITGNPVTAMLSFALPMIMANLFQQLYNLADSLIVGNYVGENALAAVGASFAITMLFICVAMGFGIGCSVVISQLLGAGKINRMKTAINTALVSILAMSIFLMFVGLVICRPILKLMDTPDNILSDAEVYLNIYFWGLPFLFMFNVISSIFNSLGKSTIPLAFLIFSSVLNVVLDIYLISSWNMGIKGAAYATLIAQALSALFSYIYLMMYLKKMTHKGSVSFFQFRILKNMCRVAIPSTVQQSIVSVGMLLIQTAVNSFGSSYIAGYTAACKIDAMAIMPIIAVGNAMSTFTAQNIGAKKTERVKSGYLSSIGMITVISAIILIVVLIFKEPIISSFLDSESGKQAIESGIEYISITAYCYVFMGLMHCTNGILRGAGDASFFLLSSLISLGLRVAIVYSLMGVAGSVIIAWAAPISWFASFLFGLARVLSGKWKNKSLVG